MIIAIISTLISSIALAAVALSLLLQARQLRVSQLQSARSAQFEFIRMQFDKPELTTAVFGDQLSMEGVLANWYMKYLELSYSLKAASGNSVLLQAELLFSGQYFREWWERAREVYQAEANGKSEREFWTIIDKAFQDARQRDLAAATSTDGKSNGQS